VGRVGQDEARQGRPARDPGLARRLAPAALASLAFHALLALALLAFGGVPSNRRFADAHVPLRMVERPGPAGSTTAARVDRDPPRAVLPQEAPATARRRPSEHRPDGMPERVDEPEAARGTPSATQDADPRLAARVPASEGDANPGPAGAASVGTGGDDGSGASTAGTVAGTGLAPPDGAGTGIGRPAATRPEGLTDGKMRYALEVRRRVVDARRYPERARKSDQAGTVVLRLRVDADGHLAATSVEAPSDWPDLDRAALAAADRLGNLPPPPGGPIEVLVPVRFSLSPP